jgi:hypothetical protein
MVTLGILFLLVEQVVGLMVLQEHKVQQVQLALKVLQEHKAQQVQLALKVQLALLVIMLHTSTAEQAHSVSQELNTRLRLQEPQVSLWDFLIIPELLPL